MATHHPEIENFDFMDWLNLWGEWITDGECAVLGAIQGGNIIGAMGIGAGQCQFSNKIHMEDMFWFVAKNHVRSTASIRLLEAARKYAIDYGAVELHVSLSKVAEHNAHILLLGRDFESSTLTYTLNLGA